MTQEISSFVSESVTSTAFGIWFLLGAALVFFMQCGFAMVETGFTRAKNAGNIIMKNLMDFCIGTVVFVLIGYSLMLGEDVNGVVGKFTFGVFTDYASFDFSNFIFNLVFCATASTIVSGAMAERTKFLSYCIYSGIISAIVYPIEAHWIWGGGWLSQWGFHDFAGSCAIHMVGGITALIGASMVGARIGKFKKDADGKVIKVKAFPGHSLTIGALGCFILWFGWYGFNGAAATSVEQLASIFVTTTIAPAIATFVCMIFTWVRYGKPDVSMCLNASLAGLVAITAGCDVVDASGAVAIGAVAGLLVVFGVWLLDYKLHIDDPVGAVAVHCLNGIWGTLAVGIFANPTVPGYEIADETGNLLSGLLYGGGVSLLGRQAVGVIVVGIWVVITMSIVFTVIKKTLGLRVSEHEELVGLDIEEHGITSSYAGFVMTEMLNTGVDTDSDNKEVPVEAAVPVQLAPNYSTSTAEEGKKYTKLEIICKQNKFEALKVALGNIGVTGITVTSVLGCGSQKGAGEYYRGIPLEPTLLPKTKVEVVVCKVPVETVVNTARKALYTGHIGDGKIFAYNIEDVVRVRTGEVGYDALQDARDASLDPCRP